MHPFGAGSRGAVVHEVPPDERAVPADRRVAAQGRFGLPGGGGPELPVAISGRDTVRTAVASHT
ncbi:hypothetical protein F3087_25580 [Nocardia colli]|uniref:Uncharacterized protein n=1 Tax=Nocardia colli TaxID=2545717 RepID=A0A5N0EAL5_9NOCA|nr:hypothetical protein [Nocardia colli]KAA8885996.1 hypothetical protein F3087_25580 [Nocardia colli]